MAAGVRAVAALPDPSGRVLARTLLDDGLVLEKVACPLGVLLVVFESRPDAVPQIASLALKSGNAAILKGGRESARSTAAILDVFAKVLAEHPGVPEGALQSVGGRAEVDALLALDDDIDLVIPRGGYDLVKHVKSQTRIPVLGHAEGVCHVVRGPRSGRGDGDGDPPRRQAPVPGRLQRGRNAPRPPRGRGEVPRPAR